jgi:hypothetical protein
MTDAGSASLVANRSERRLLHDPFLYGTAAFALMMCGPVSRYLGSLADEGLILHGATRLLRGEVIYRDFFEVVPPGGFLIVATWMTIVGADFGSTRVLAVGLIAAIAALTYASVVLASGRRVLGVVLAAAWAVRAPFENNHHWLTTAASMAASVCVLLAFSESPTRRAAAFAAGLFAGIAVTVTQTRGALLCAAVLVVVLGARRRVASALAGMVVSPVAMVIYLALTGALRSAADDLIWFNAQRYVDVQYVPFATFATWADAVTVAVFPLAFLLTGIVVALKPHGTIWHDPRGRAALAFAIIGLVGAFPRPDIAHINFTVPLACPLIAFCVTHIAHRLPRPAYLAMNTLVIGLCVIALAYATKRRVDVIIEPLETIATPSGVALRRPAPWTTDVARLMAELDRLPTGDPVFFYPYLPLLPYLADRQHPGAVDAMVPGYTTPAQFRAACERAVHHAKWLVVDRTWSDPRKLRALFPVMTDHHPPEKRAFEGAVIRAFDTVVHRSATFELRQRGLAAVDTECVTP